MGFHHLFKIFLHQTLLVGELSGRGIFVAGTSNALRGVTFFGSRILIVGENRTVLYADDVDDFQPGTLAGGSATNYWLEAVTSSPQLAVAAGDDHPLSARSRPRQHYATRSP